MTETTPFTSPSKLLGGRAYSSIRPRPSRQEWPPVLSQEIADAIAEREGRMAMRSSLRGRAV